MAKCGLAPSVLAEARTKHMALLASFFPVHIKRFCLESFDSCRRLRRSWIDCSASGPSFCFFEEVCATWVHSNFSSDVLASYQPYKGNLWLILLFVVGLLGRTVCLFWIFVEIDFIKLQSHTFLSLVLYYNTNIARCNAEWPWPIKDLQTDSANTNQKINTPPKTLYCSRGLTSAPVRSGQFHCSFSLISGSRSESKSSKLSHRFWRSLHWRSSSWMYCSFLSRNLRCDVRFFSRRFWMEDVRPEKLLSHS